MAHTAKCKSTNNNEWRHCPVCSGRSHLAECTTPKKSGIDCMINEEHSPDEYAQAGFPNDGYINGIHISIL